MRNHRADGATAPTVTIKVVRGKSASKSREMTGTSLLLGSDLQCDVQMRSIEVAAQHCLISRHDGRVQMRQLDADFPVLVNGKPVEAAELTDGDVLTVGPFELGISICADSANRSCGGDTESSGAAASDASRRRSAGAEILKLTRRISSAAAPTDASTDEQIASQTALAATPKTASGPRVCEDEAAAGTLLSSMTAESVACNRKKRLVEQQASRLRAIRRRVVTQLRDRRQRTDDEARALQSQDAELASRRRLLDREISHWKKVGDTLSRKEIELARREESIAGQERKLAEHDSKLAAKSAKLDSELAALVTRQQAIEKQNEAQLRERNEISKLHEAVLMAKETADAELQQVRQAAAALRREAADVTSRAQTAEKQQSSLHNLARSLEEQRQSLTQRESDLCARAADIEQTQAKQEALAEQNAARQNALAIQEREQREEVSRLERLKSEVDRIAIENAAESESLTRRTEDLLAQSQAVMERIRTEQESLVRQRNELANVIERKEKEFAEKCKDLERQRELIQVLADQCNRKAVALDRETKRLQERSENLARSEESLRESERQWRLQADNGSEQLLRRGQELTVTQQHLANQVSVHKGNVQRLRQVARKLAEQRKGATKAALHSGHGKRDNVSPAVDPAHVAPEWQLDAGTIVHVIHAGAVATTYRISIAGQSTPMALRLLAPDWCRDELLRRSFEIAVASLCSFRHPQIVSVHAFARTFDRYGMVMDFIDGESLANLAGTTLPGSALLPLCHQAVSAVAAAQRAGYMHRNLRPSQLLVDRAGILRLIGIGEPEWLRNAYRCELGRRLAAYLAPEDRSGDEQVDARADLYSVGRVFQILSRNRPADDRTEPAVLESFQSLLDQMTAATPAQRCRSLAEIHDRLDELVQKSGHVRFDWSELGMKNDPSATIGVHSGQAA